MFKRIKGLEVPAISITLLGVATTLLVTFTLYRGDIELLKITEGLTLALGILSILSAMGLFLVRSIIKENEAAYNELSRTYGSLEVMRYNLQMILDNSSALIITTNTNGEIVEFNREAEKVLGYKKFEVVGRKILSLYEGTEGSERVSGSYEGDDVWASRVEDLTMVTKDGEKVKVNITLSTLIDKEGKITGTVGIGRDITEELTLHEKLIQSEKLAGLGTLASGIAHEINNPLAAILSMAEAILEEEGDEVNVKRYAGNIVQYSLDAAHIVSELGRYSRRRDKENTTVTDISTVIESALQIAGHSTSMKSIKVEKNFEDGCLAHINEREMQQVFVNLIRNGVDSMDDRGLITLRSFRCDNYIIVEVGDTGCGMEDDEVKRIFEPFYTSKCVGSGTGLGLYIVYKIVSAQGGLIEVNSEVGSGTVFKVSLPAKRDVELTG